MRVGRGGVNDLWPCVNKYVYISFMDLVILLGSSILAMERNGLFDMLSKMTNSFRACMVDEYLKSYLAHYNADAVVVMNTDNKEMTLRVSSLEVQPGGVFLRFSKTEEESLVRNFGVESFDELSLRGGLVLEVTEDMAPYIFWCFFH